MILRWLLFMNVCECGDHRQAHEHWRNGSECTSCNDCFRFRRYWVPRPGWTVWRR